MSELRCFGVSEYGLTGHVLPMNGCGYVWIGANDEPATLDAMSLAHPEKHGDRFGPCTTLIGSNASSGVLNQVLSRKAGMPVLLSLSDRVSAVFEEAPMAKQAAINAVLAVLLSAPLK